MSTVQPNKNYLRFGDEYMHMHIYYMPSANNISCDHHIIYRTCIYILEYAVYFGGLNMDGLNATWIGISPNQFHYMQSVLSCAHSVD
jgi:hypothetical protein